MPSRLVSVSGPYHGNESFTTEDGTGFIIGDGYVLTAGHVAFEWNRNIDNVAIEHMSGIALDYQGYSELYRIEVQGLIDFFFPDSESELGQNELIEGEGSLPANDSVVISQSGVSAGKNDPGLVVFLDYEDLGRVTTALPTPSGGSASEIYRQANVTHTSHGTVKTIASDGFFTFSAASTKGDSGGAYLLKYDGRSYVVGRTPGMFTRRRTATP